MVTSERAEVAGRIRATVGDASACNGLHHLWRAVTGETAPELGRETRGELFLTLADLIDPTCRNTRYDGGFGCDACGWEAEADPVGMPGDYGYCPSCGARVVS